MQNKIMFEKEINKRLSDELWNYKIAETVIENYNKQKFIFFKTKFLWSVIAMILLIFGLFMFYNNSLSTDNKVNSVLENYENSVIVNNLYTYLE